MRDYLAEHLERVKTAVLKQHTAATIAKWLVENTTLDGQPYSFDDHEYQERIVNDISKEVNVQKCSQVGISELAARIALSLVNVIQPYTVIYTLQTGKFATTFAKTRIDGIIAGSPAMKANIHATNDNQELKQFGQSYIYIKGAASSNAPISIPADHLIHDEVDFSDQEVLGMYQSRVTHSKWRRFTRFSTPTLPGFGINKHFNESRRFFNFCKCRHCNFQFVPDYYEHVRIPHYKGELRDMTKNALRKTDWRNAYVECPACGGKPSLQPEHREWVCANASEMHIAAAYQVTPFDAPNIVDAPYLVEKSTAYPRIQDFVNFNLGLPMEDSEATLTDEDFEGLFHNIDIPGSTVNVMGVDVGNTYHFKVGAVDPFDNIVVIHSEMVPMGSAKKRYFELKRQFKVICTVMDSLPHSETVMALQDLDDTMYASVYMRSKSVLTHNVVERTEDKSEGRTFVRQVNVNRSKALDAYMEFIRNKRLNFRRTELESTIINHHCSMKRVKTFDPESGELAYSWQKTDGEDHFHHAGLYMFIASRIRAVGRGLIVLPLGRIRTMNLRPK